MRNLFSAKNRIVFYLVLWFCVNLLFLDRFPFMHSDESWLSGLTRDMMQEGPGTTESFFDLYPRHPHALKLVFHALQMPLILVFGYNLFAVRLLSLLFGLFSLAAFYRLVLRLFQKQSIALIATVALSLDVQFLYASHMARQDIIIAFGTIVAFDVFAGHHNQWGKKHDIRLALLIGSLIGVHPNSLFAALAAGALYCYFIMTKQVSMKNLARFAAALAMAALLFLGISYWLDPQFLAHYGQYGETLGVAQTPLQKLAALPHYYRKLFLRVSGTYYTPPIMAQLLLFGASALALCAMAFRSKRPLLFLLPAIAINLGFAAIGRYSQPAVVILFPAGYLMLACAVTTLLKQRAAYALAALAAVLCAVSAVSVKPYWNDDYRQYLSAVNQSVPKDAKVLANLNAEFAFEREGLLDYRNLAYLEQNHMSVAQYLEGHGITYVLYPQEMNFIYQNRPTWNVLYGNVFPYYDELQAFLQERCVLVDTVTTPYAQRIAAYRNQGDWTLRIYRVLESET